jgi:hypothetical protein
MFGIKQEPTVVINAASEAIRQIIPMLVVLGVLNMTGEKASALNIVVGVFMGFLTTLYSRSQTVPNATADKQIEVAIASPADTAPDKVKQIVAAQQASNELRAGND